ncbi:hypothetical protein BC939DRAFT_506181 [Gamsiella multidivaricata]|uniref:uncharacterized protein n=1 Tax=Gamsiella multidivaricata TaxID=101098 RepID=UPI002220E8D8|nr:uncharacterized protein BC939DRAFT_506181 [Gamsiella multidivaricata]KAG0361991.1 hypothetical protein BGZ54_008832 [Gamsiella multidivaricata]KAI7818959.1 hypothetical protein BC939DRAFT_506181 [Gamsiella multidivaricata]
MSLRLDPYDLTDIGMDCVERVLERSKDLQELKVDISALQELNQQNKLARLLRGQSKRLTALSLEGDSAHEWIPKAAELCPARCDLPILRGFCLSCPKPFKVPHPFVQWIVSMVSPWSRVSALMPYAQWFATQPSPMTLDNVEELFQDTYFPPLLEIAEMWMPLMDVYLKGLEFEPEDWKRIIAALDLSTLETLNLSNSNFSQEQLTTLIELIPQGTNPVRRLKLHLYHTDLVICPSTITLLRKLAEKAPHIEIDIYNPCDS